MGQKSLIQLIIVFIIILISSAVYLNYFTKDSEDLATKIKISKTENIKDETSNYIENISYISKIGENKYEIIADRTKIKINEPDIMFLENVAAFITLRNSSTIKVTSDFAKYNSKNYDTIFSKNVIATYPGHKITGELLDFSFVNNIGTFSTNIVYVGSKTKMIADKMEVNLTNNDTKIFMLDQSKKVIIEGIN
ncbi:LPS export ABC transporter periplasmic protein LptC [Candidatus Pelagibacter ubique]|nr:LPS export ABC transporter periplasmic protein LptC [Candidatus Pelagibacter ubique]